MSRFSKLANKLAHKKGVTDPKAVAAVIGRRKYGAKKFSQMGQAGKRHEALVVPDISEMVDPRARSRRLDSSTKFATNKAKEGWKHVSKGQSTGDKSRGERSKADASFGKYKKAMKIVLKKQGKQAPVSWDDSNESYARHSQFATPQQARKEGKRLAGKYRVRQTKKTGSYKYSVYFNRSGRKKNS